MTELSNARGEAYVAVQVKTGQTWQQLLRTNAGN